MRHYMVETPSSYRKSISCVRPWSDRSWITWRHSAEMRWDKTRNTKKHLQTTSTLGWLCWWCVTVSWSVMQWLVPAAEHSASGCSGLFPVQYPVGSWGPEEQQTEPAVCQPVEPQPQTRVLWDPDVCEFTSSHSSFETVSLDRTAVLTPSSLLQVRTLESIKQQAQQHDMTHLTDVVQRLALQSRTWTLASCQEHVTTEKRRNKMPYCVFCGVDKHFEYILSSNIWHQLFLKPVPKPLIH